jgi:hypothetical protein
MILPLNHTLLHDMTHMGLTDVVFVVLKDALRRVAHITFFKGDE